MKMKGYLWISLDINQTTMLEIDLISLDILWRSLLDIIWITEGYLYWISCGIVVDISGFVRISFRDLSWRCDWISLGYLSRIKLDN